MSLKNLLTVQTWEITLLTPLHVGDGSSHFLDQDYIVNGRNIEILDLDDLLEHLEDNPGAINEMGRGQFSLSKFIRDYKLSVTPRYVFANVTTKPKDIRRFLKNAHGQVYIPGSSLKGALRTALLQLTLERFHSYQDFFYLSKQVKAYKSSDPHQSSDPDPHYDFLRPLHVSDSEGLAPMEGLSLAEVKFFNLQAADTPGWKDFASKRTGPDFRQATGLFVEALKTGTKVHVQIGLDEFLLSESGSKAANLPRDNALLNFQTMAQVMNQHAFKLATAEKAFFAKHGDATAGATDFYRKLLTLCTTPAEDGFYLRMAWGSGWRGMTGNWLSGQELEKVRKEANLGKNFCPECNTQLRANPKSGFYRCRECQKKFPTTQLAISDIFPKSRRLAMQDGVPALPLGWVYVRPTEKNLFRNIARTQVASGTAKSYSGQGLSTPSSPAQPTPNQFKAISPPGKNQEIQRQEEVAAFKTSLPRPDALAGQIGSLLGIIRAKEDDETRKLCCQALLDLAKTNKKKFNSAVKDKKDWVVKLSELCAELGVKLT